MVHGGVCAYDKFYCKFKTNLYVLQNLLKLPLSMTVVTSFNPKSGIKNCKTLFPAEVSTLN